MADNFSDKVVKKLQKQNLAVDLTEDVVVEAAPEEVTSQSQDFQTMTANSGNPGTSTNGKDIVIIPGVSATTQASTSQINFYWEKPTTQGTDNTDTFMRSTIYNYVEGASPNEEPVLAIGGYNGTHYAPSLTYGGGTGQTVARIWFHPFSGTIDAAKLVLEQANNTPQISFGSTATTQSLTTAGDLAWDGTSFKVHNGTSVQTLAYSSQVPGAQDIFKNMTDGTTTASADGTNDTFTFTAGAGITCSINSSTDTLTIATSSIPNSSLTNSSVTIGSTTISLGSTATTISGLTSVTSTTFNGNLVAGNIRINSAAGQIDTTSGNLTIDSTGGTTTIADNLTVTGTSVSFTNATTTTLSAANATVTLAGATSTISANSNKITNVATPTADADAATKAYVDAVKTGLDVHASVRCVITAQIAGNYVQASPAGSTSSGVATITYTATGATVVDTTVTLALNDRVLVTGGIGGSVTANGVGITNGSDTEKFSANGIYYVSTAGTTGVATVLTRALDTDDNLELEGGTFTFVQEGQIYEDTGWVCTTNTSVTPIVFAPSTGTAGRIQFTQFTGAGKITVTAPLSKNVNTISLSLKANGGLTTESNALAVDLSASSITGTLAVGDGGTGLTSFTDKGVFYASSTSAVGQATGTSGQLLVANATLVPTFVTLSGDATLAAAGGLTLANTAVTAGSYGSSTSVATFSVDSKGRLTAAGSAAIPAATSSVLGLASFSTTHFTVASGAVSLNTVAIASGGLNRTSAISGFVYGDGTAYAAATAANINSLHGSQSANTFYAAPNGSASTPSFRAIVLADLPTITVGKGGTGLTTQTSAGITYHDGTNITSGTALTWRPAADTGTGSNSALYVNAASLTQGTVVTINALGTATGKLISGSLGGTEKFSVDVNGNLRATTKSFDIPHPTKEGMRLVYGVLEGPEHGVYHRGTVEGKDKLKVELPEYWHKLVGENYSVQLTSWGPYAVHLVEKTEHYFIIQLSSNFVMRKLKTIKVDYVVHGARLDAPLEIEQ